MIEPDTVQVEVYSGHTFAQEPRAFVWQGARYEVVGIEERWRTPEGPVFRLRTGPRRPTSRLCAGPAGLFDLHYHEFEDRWLARELET